MWKEYTVILLNSCYVKDIKVTGVMRAYIAKDLMNKFWKKYKNVYLKDSKSDDKKEQIK